MPPREHRRIAARPSRPGDMLWRALVLGSLATAAAVALSGQSSGRDLGAGDEPVWYAGDEPVWYDCSREEGISKPVTCVNCVRANTAPARTAVAWPAPPCFLAHCALGCSATRACQVLQFSDVFSVPAVVTKNSGQVRPPSLYTRMLFRATRVPPSGRGTRNNCSTRTELRALTRTSTGGEGRRGRGQRQRLAHAPAHTAPRTVTCIRTWQQVVHKSVHYNGSATVPTIAADFHQFYRLFDVWWTFLSIKNVNLCHEHPELCPIKAGETVNLTTVHPPLNPLTPYGWYRSRQVCRERERESIYSRGKPNTCG